MGLLLVLIKSLQPYVGPGMMLGYPLYQSINAIESPYKDDDEQWLTYWVIYSFIALFELAFERVIELIPLWPYMKLILVCWLVLPQFRGGCFIYRNYVRPYLWNMKNQHFEQHNDSHYTDKQRELLTMMSADARTAVAQYISEHGTDAFERLITAASKQAAKGKSSPKTPKSKSSPIKNFFKHHSPTNS